MKGEKPQTKAKPEVSGKPSSAHRVEKVCELGGEVGRAHVGPLLVLVPQPDLELRPPAGHRHEVAAHHQLQLVDHLVDVGQVRGVEGTRVDIGGPSSVGAVELVVHLVQGIIEKPSWGEMT